MRTRVKICGLTRVQDVQTAVDLGADAVGLVFHAPSPRAVTVNAAVALAQVAPAFVTVVGLFVDADPEAVRVVLGAVPLGALQFHGSESPEYCASFGRPWIKAVAMREGIDSFAAFRRFGGAGSLLLDTHDAQLPGGTGRRFDWDLVPREMAPRVVLAGGLDAGNVADAIIRVRPYAVDVSGGVESAKGIKDHAKIAEFMRGVRNGDKIK